LESKPNFHPRTYKALNIGVISFGFDERLEACATIAASLPSTSKALRMFRQPFNDLRAWHVLQDSRKRDRDLLSPVGKEPDSDWRPAPLNTYSIFDLNVQVESTMGGHGEHGDGYGYCFSRDAP
jgi:hypothetical protein